MRVVYLCAKHPPYDARIFYKISITLSNNGLDIININPNAKESIKNRIKILGFKQKEGFIGRLFSLYKLYKIGKNINADVLIAPEPDSLLVAYYIKKKQKDVKIIFDSHEHYYNQFNSYFNNKYINNLLNKLIDIDRIINYLIKKIYGVIVVTDKMRKKYKKINTNTYLIPNTNNFISSGRYLLNKSNLFDSKKYFIYVGTIYYPEVILDAAKILKINNENISILVLGGFFGKKNNNYNKKIKYFKDKIFQGNLQEYITFIEWVPYYMVQEYIMDSLGGLILMSPKSRNSDNVLPNKLFDYMASGIPIITFDYPEVSKIVQEEKCGIVVKENNARSLVNAMLIIVKNKSKKEIMGKNSYLAMKNKYDWSFYEKTLIKIVTQKENY
jgi:glycosyltransferase involved in cell wall biosynthesis